MQVVGVGSTGSATRYMTVTRPLHEGGGSRLQRLATCMKMRVAATFSSLSPPPTPRTPFVASPSLPLGGLFRFGGDFAAPATCPLARRTPVSASICSHCGQLSALNVFSSFTAACNGHVTVVERSWNGHVTVT